MFSGLLRLLFVQLPLVSGSFKWPKFKIYILFSVPASRELFHEKSSDYFKVYHNLHHFAEERSYPGREVIVMCRYVLSYCPLIPLTVTRAYRPGTYAQYTSHKSPRSVKWEIAYGVLHASLPYAGFLYMNPTKFHHPQPIVVETFAWLWPMYSVTESGNC